MLNQKEIGVVLLLSIVLGLIISAVTTWERFYYIAVVVLVIIGINVIAKKVVGFYFDSEVEIKIWNVERYWIGKYTQFEKPIPAGILVPIFLKVFSFGYLNWLAVTTFDVKAKTYRAAKRFGLYTFSEMSEFHIGLIAAAGIVANLALGVIAYFVNVPDLARFSIYYAFFNMIPISDLDGSKIFFGSVLLWSLLAAIVVVGVFFALIII